MLGAARRCLAPSQARFGLLLALVVCSAVLAWFALSTSSLRHCPVAAHAQPHALPGPVGSGPATPPSAAANHQAVDDLRARIRLLEADLGSFAPCLPLELMLSVVLAESARALHNATSATLAANQQLLDTLGLSGPPRAAAQPDRNRTRLLLLQSVAAGAGAQATTNKRVDTVCGNRTLRLPASINRTLEAGVAQTLTFRLATMPVPHVPPIKFVLDDVAARFTAR